MGNAPLVAALRAAVALCATIILALFALSSAPPVASALLSTGDGGWLWQNPLPQGNDLTDVEYIDQDHLCAVGERGVVLISSDGGVTWEHRATPTTKTLCTVSFADETHGWAVGFDGVILATADGGRTWTAQESGTMGRLNAVDFIDQYTGWAAGDEGLVLSTHDGGLSWQAENLGVFNYFTNVTFVDADHGWLVSHGVVLATIDGGRHWSDRTPAPNGNPVRSLGVAFADERHGWVTEEFGRIFATSDGGETWTLQYGADSLGLGGIVCSDANHACAVADNTLIYTDDGGASWQAATLPAYEGWLGALALTADGQAYAVGRWGLMLSSTDAGANWILRSRDTGWHDLAAITCVDADHACAVGFDGAIRATSDGGETWMAHNQDIYSCFSAVSFVDADYGWVVGGSGIDSYAIIMATSDGGASWQQQDALGKVWLNGVAFVDRRHGWAASGADGVILATADGGASWQTQDSQSDAPFLDIAFVDAQHGWIAGYGVLLATSDGGTTWTKQISDPDLRFEALDFVDAQHGWAIAQLAELLSTSDGGSSWQSQGPIGERPLLDVEFVDREHGWLTDDEGTVWASSDGGQTWQVQDSGVHRWLYGIAFADANHGWLVGEGNTIMATITGGWPSANPDSTPPTTTLSDADAAWHAGPVLLTLSAADNPGGSGMSGGAARSEYRLDDGPWTTGTTLTVPAPLDHSGDGVHTISYRSTDAAGNREAVKSATVRIDTLAPVTTTVRGADALWHNTPVTIALAASDATSQVATLNWTLDGGPPQPYDGIITVASPGSHPLRYWATDLAGNAETPANLTVKIDIAKPSCSTARNVTVRRGQRATLAFKISDPQPSCGSAKGTIAIKRKTKTVKTISLGNVTVNKARSYRFKVTLKKGSYTWTVRASDAAGNVAKASTPRKLIVR